MGTEHYRTATRITLESLRVSLGTSYIPLRSRTAFPERTLFLI